MRRRMASGGVHCKGRVVHFQAGTMIRQDTLRRWQSVWRE
jgi:hypothetical protein